MMNGQGYKAIARIMRYHIKENDNDLKHPAMTKERHDDVARFIETICSQLADYFEREYNKKVKKEGRWDKKFQFREGWELYGGREQFLKECGVI